MPKKKRRNTVCLAFESLLLPCLSSSNNTLFLFSIFFPFNFPCCSLKSQRNHSPGSAQGRRPWKLEKEVRVEICTFHILSAACQFPSYESRPRISFQHPGDDGLCCPHPWHWLFLLVCRREVPSGKRFAKHSSKNQSAGNYLKFKSFWEAFHICYARPLMAMGMPDWSEASSSAIEVLSAQQIIGCL